ncbi:MAG: hypothetical protein EAZ95_12105 [Bacteroidetes bacterium]|nr:MAG: hypothetical protein EAZ95_12105 [Bacteroidota bacterium]
MFLLLAGLHATLHAQSVPTKITYQGILYESGTPFTGTKNFVFTIGTWSETQNNVAITNGRYSVVLGSITPLTVDLFKNSSSLVLQIQANGTNLTPNIDLISAPYAMVSGYATDAGNAQTFGGNSPAHYLDYQNLTNRPKVAFLKDVKLNTADGGASVANTWIQRELNTTEGDGSFVTLSAHRFTLPAGTYTIEASVPAHAVNRHVAKLYNFSDNADVAGGLGTLAFSPSGAQADSKINAVVTLNTSKTFEIRHICAATNVNGLGYNIATTLGTPNIPNSVYTVVKITKLQ